MGEWGVGSGEWGVPLVPAFLPAAVMAGYAMATGAWPDARDDAEGLWGASTVAGPRISACGSHGGLRDGDRRVARCVRRCGG